MTFLVLTLVSCSYFFEPKEKVREADISSTDTQCLSQTSKVFNRYFNDFKEAETLDASVENQVHCLKNAVGKFSKYVKSGEGNGKRYNAQEILNVLHVFFTEESLPFDLSLGFIENLLKIKEFVIGGDNKSLTKKELLRLDKFFGVFGELFLNIRPYREVLLDHKFRLPKTMEERDRFDDAFFLLRDSLNDVLNLIKEWNGKKPFDIYKAGEFLMSSYYGDEYNKQKPYLDLYIEFKKMVLNDDHSFVKRKDFDFLVHQTLRTHYSIFEYNHFVEDGKLFNSLGTLTSFIVKVPSQLSHGKVLSSITYDSLLRIYERGAETLVHAARRGPEGRIAMDKIGGLLEAMAKVKYLGSYLSAESLTIFISNLANGWMVDGSLKVKDSKKGTHSYQPFLTEEKIKYTLSHLRGWQERQDFINKTIKDQSEINLNDIKVDKLPASVKSWIQALKKVNLKHWIGIQDDEDEVASSFRLLFSKNDQRLDYRELTANNSVYTEIMFFMQPFQRVEKNVMDYSVNENQAQSIYELMRHIGIELAFMDSRIDDTGRRAFMEANLFSTIKKPDSKIDIYEGFELMNYMYNSSILSEEIFAEIPEQYKKKEVDVLRKSLIEPNGYRHFLNENYMKYFLQLPGLQKHWSNLSKEQRKEFMNTLEKASRGGVISETAMDMGAIRILVATSYYLESFFYNFESDEDSDDYVHGAELVQAEKHFHGHVLKLAEDSKNKKRGRERGDPDWEEFDPDLVDNVFYSILYYKALPDPDSWGNWYTVGLANPKQKISRSDVLHVFAILADVARKGTVDKLKKFLAESQTKLLHEIEILSEVPKCHKRKMLFCEWARILQCSTDVYGHLFRQMPISRNRFHDVSEVGKTIEDLAEWMRKDDILLQTKCSYPHIKDTKDEEKSESDLPDEPDGGA